MQKKIVLMRRILLISIFLILSLVLIPKQVKAANVVETWNISATSSDNVTATLYDDEKLVISGTGKMKGYNASSNDDFHNEDFSKQINRIIVEDGILIISRNAFSNCINLIDVELPESIEAIGAPKMYIMISDSGIELSEDLKEEKRDEQNLISEVFFNCPKLKNINVNESNKYYSSVNGVLFNKAQTEIDYYPQGRIETKYIIPNTVKKIRNRAFQNAINLTEIEIPEGVKTIKEYAFANCKKIKEINMPSSVCWIGTMEFVTNGFGQEYICTEASFVFAGCEALEKINVDENNETFCSDDGILFNKDKSSILIYPNAKQGDIYNIPNSVTLISAVSFLECNNLEKIIISSQDIKINILAFLNCNNLKKININKNVKNLQLHSDNITNTAFPMISTMDIDNLNWPKEIIVDSENEIYSSEDGILFNKNKTNLLFYPGEKDSTSYTIPDTVTEIGEFAFFSCPHLSKLIIPSSVMDIKSSFYLSPEEFTIYCSKDSYAEKYAQDNNIKFEYLENKKFNLTIDPAGGNMLLPKIDDSAATVSREAYNNLQFTYGTQRLFMKTAHTAMTIDPEKAFLGTYSGKAINGDNLMIKDGCKFKQWKIISGEGQIIDEPVEGDENGTIHNYYFDGKCEGDVVIRAEWETLPTITVDPNGADMKLVKDEIITQPQSVTFYYGNKEKRVFAKVGKISGAENSQDKWFCFTRMNDLNIPYREGYTFDGWKITEGTGEITEEQDEDGRYSYYYDCSYNGNVTIQAQWKKVDSEVPEPIKIEIKENPKTIKSISKIGETQYLIVDKNTKAEDILKDLIINSEDFELEIKGATSNEETAKTNQEVAIEGSDEATNMVVIVKGDVDSNGEVSFRDILKLNNYRLNKEQNIGNWNSAEKIAFKSITETDITNEEIDEISFKDVITFNNFRLRN